MSSHAAPPPRHGSRLRVILGLSLLVAIVAAGLVTFQLLRGGSAGPATAETTEAGADSTSAREADGEKKKSGDKDEKKDDDERDERVPVEVARVERRDVPTFFSGTASLEADSEARILARTNGQVVSLPVEAGDLARKGDMLVELDGGEQKVTLEERKAELIALRHDLDRQQALYDKNLGSESELLGVKARFDAAEARRRAAELSVELTHVRAPFAGVVTRRSVDLGQSVTAGTEILHLADATPLRAAIFMPERQVSRIRVGQPVEVRSDAAEDRTFTGRVERVAPVVDSRTGTVKVTVELDAAAGSPLMPGSFVHVNVEIDRHGDALTIPSRSVIEQGGERFVFRLDEARKAHRVRVETGYGIEDHVEVLSGLAEGDVVVTAGHGALRNESEVRVIGEPDPEAVGDTGVDVAQQAQGG